MGKKIACDKCPKMAVWMYMPSGTEANFCDECVPRGCSCNVWDGVEDTDEKGRLLPCCEYLFDEEGFDVDPAELALDSPYYDDKPPV